MSQKLVELFARAKSENRALLIAYLPAGFPTVQMSHELIEALVNNGVDLIEVGYPYSDPLMDGPTIQSAVEIALVNGTKAKDVFAALKKVNDLGAAGVVMSYFSPIFKYGIVKFLDQLAEVGGAGVITPDLTPEEAELWLAEMNKQNLAQIFLVAPSSTDERIESITNKTSGFVYAASLMGVTGVKTAKTDMAKQLVARVRAQSDLPVAVGLGVNTPAQVKEIAQFADAVIVGSAFIKAVLEAPSEQAAILAVGELAAGLAAATSRD
jgi:tryptophan synthase alpha chain